MLKYVPNTLTVIRFLLIPVLIILALQGDYIGTAIIFTISGITDILDGYIARKFKLISDFGKLMDPLADKSTQISILTVLVIQEIIPFWILLVVILKEVLMIAGASFLYGKDFVVSSKWFGKLATVLFYIAIVCSLFVNSWNNVLFTHPEYSAPMLPQFDLYLYYLAVISTLFAFVMYIKALFKQGVVKKEDILKNK